MFQDAFIRIDRAECEAILSEVNPALKGTPFNAQGVTMLGQDLSFYPGYRFLDIADYESVPPVRKYVIYKPGDVVPLNWSNAPIYALNDRTKLGITAETAADYVRFFFTYVQGRAGKFTVVENVDDIEWSDEPPPAARKAVGQMLKPVTVEEQEKDGGFRLSACMTFQNALYKLTVRVGKTGRVSTADETVLVDDMPVRDGTLG